ncbi:hypothetical protein [Pedobacter aquatilis]|uniref:hypothetical protein n=1 Tax=Pedobacter aquatilis TaxID=351343 RepID=UPI002930918C|nr:hypothetical protein [Pedobacter aquatilis]
MNINTGLEEFADKLKAIAQEIYGEAQQDVQLYEAISDLNLLSGSLEKGRHVWIKHFAMLFTKYTQNPELPEIVKRLYFENFLWFWKRFHIEERMALSRNNRKRLFPKKAGYSNEQNIALITTCYLELVPEDFIKEHQVEVLEKESCSLEYFIPLVFDEPLIKISVSNEGILLEELTPIYLKQINALKKQLMDCILSALYR